MGTRPYIRRRRRRKPWAPALRTTAMNRALFSRNQQTWRTPEDVYAELDREFHFTLDPCPARHPREAGLPLFGTD